LGDTTSLLSASQADAGGMVHKRKSRQAIAYGPTTSAREEKLKKDRGASGWGLTRRRAGVKSHRKREERESVKGIS